MQTPKTTWTWKVTYQTAAIASGNAETKELAEAKAVQVHDRNVVAGLNADWLAYFVNPPEPNRFAEAGRADKANALAKDILRRASEQHIATDSADLIHWYDGFSDTREWFQVWRAAKVGGPPSDECKALVRKTLLQRLPIDELVKTWGPCGGENVEEYKLTAEDRALLLERETAAAIRSHDFSAERGS